MVRLQNTNKAVHDGLASDGVRTFIMLRLFLEDSDLCNYDCGRALRKYLRGISAAKVDEIRRSCPAALHAVDGRLSKKKQAGPMEQQVIEAVLKTGKEDMIKNPESFLGRDGWFMALARDLARVPPKTTKRGSNNDAQGNQKTAKPGELSTYMVQNFGFGEFEVALFLAVTAFARVSRPDKTFPPETRAVIQHSFWQMFKFGNDYDGCNCKMNEHLYRLEDAQSKGKMILATDDNQVNQLKKMVLAMTKEMATYAPQLGQLVELENMYMRSTDLERNFYFVATLTEARWGSEDLGRALYQLKKDRLQEAKEAQISAETADAEQTKDDEKAVEMPNKQATQLVMGPKLPHRDWQKVGKKATKTKA